VTFGSATSALYLPAGFAEGRHLKVLLRAACLFTWLLLTAAILPAQSDSTARRADVITSELGQDTRQALASTPAGSRTVEKGSRVDGSVFVRDGTLRVAGEINGDAIVQNGDLIVVEGGRITGDAIAIDGSIRVDGGVVDGRNRSLRGSVSSTTVTADSGARTRDAVKAVAGVFAIILIIGIATLILSEAPLLGVARAAARDVSRSFWVGTLWQFLAVPLLVTAIAACAITLIGIVVIPFVVIAWILIYAGALTLGLLATAYLTGRALGGRGTGVSTRGFEVRALTIGVLVLGMIWLLAALLVSVPIAGVLARLVALALTWVGATVGLGAVVRSRGGRRVEDREPTSETAVPMWQTPTPVGGVVAARRPSVTPSSTDVL
jgi:hypothetical protein